MDLREDGRKQLLAAAAAATPEAALSPAARRSASGGGGGGATPTANGTLAETLSLESTLGMGGAGEGAGAESWGRRSRAKDTGKKLSEADK